MDALFAVLDVALLASTIRLVSPILLAALGGLLSERVGIFNVGLEGLMLVAGLFLGGLEVGAAGMARSTDVPLQLVDVVQATIILVVAIRVAIRLRVRRALRVD